MPNNTEKELEAKINAFHARGYFFPTKEDLEFCVGLIKGLIKERHQSKDHIVIAKEDVPEFFESRYSSGDEKVRGEIASIVYHAIKAMKEEV